MSELGKVLNVEEVSRVSSFVKSGTTVIPGLVYIDGANGIKQAPVDGSKKGVDLYWFDKSVVATEDRKEVVFELDGIDVIGTSDGIIPVNGRCKPSTNVAGAFETHPIPTVADEGDTSMVDLGAQIAAATQAVYTFFENVVAIYRGHEKEIKEGGTKTASGDTETNCVFRLRSGN